MRKIFFGIVAAVAALTALALPNTGFTQSTASSGSSVQPAYAPVPSAPILTTAKGSWEGANRASGDLTMRFYDTPDGVFNAQVWFGGASNCFGPWNASGQRTGNQYTIQMQTDGCGHLVLQLVRAGNKIGGSYRSSVYGDGMIGINF